jgi:hypothetical protein
MKPNFSLLSERQINMNAQKNQHAGFKYKFKKTVYAIVEILEGDDRLGGDNVKGYEHMVTDPTLGRGLELLAEDGSTETYHVYDGILDPQDEDHKMPANEKNIPWIVIHADNIPKNVSKKRTVATCAYNATDTYMKHWLGMGMDHYDKDWYTLNSLVTEDGLPQANSFTVIQQLVKPYGLGVSHIYVPRNNRRFREYLPFIKSLGANPFFATDGYTTNEEALVKLFPNDEHKQNEMRDILFAQWRFECRDECPGGVIAMTQFHENSTGHNGASTYRGPRAPGNYDKWKMALKVDRLENITYLKPVDIPEYEEYEGKKVLDLWGIRNSDGKTVRGLKNAKTSARGSIYGNSWYKKLEDDDKKKEAKDDDDKSSNFQGSNDDDPTEPPSKGGWGYFDDLFGEGWFGTRTSPGKYDYPPVCENCQQDPGERYVSGTKICQHCESPQEKNYKDPFR